MGVPSNILRASTSLRLGERVVVRCVDGPVAAEYALFDAGEIVLRSADPVSVREMGYITTAGNALARLARAGITPALAKEAAEALAPGVVISYARAPIVRSLTHQLSAEEIFDGAIFRAGSQAYEGAWLRLQPLVSAVSALASGVADVAFAFQAFHLAMVLSEVSDQTTLQLSTANITRTGRSGERTYRRLSFEGAQTLPGVLRTLPPNPLPVELDAQSESALRIALLARVRERAGSDATPKLRVHLEALEAALSSGSPHRPLDSPELRAIDQQLAAGDAKDVDPRLDALERAHGPSAALRYLRARAAFVRGDESPHKVAQVLSAIADEETNFHEAELVAARAWLAAGEDAHARYFAHRLVDDATAGESARLVALEILEETGRTTRSNAPPPASAQPAAGAQFARTAFGVPVVDPALDPMLAIHEAPPGASLPPVAPARPPPPVVAPPPAASAPAQAAVAQSATGQAATRAATAQPATGQRSKSPMPPAGLPKSDPPVRYDAELLESLSLPTGLAEEELAPVHTPTTPAQARVAMTRLTRTLGRDYRLWYGITLRCNLLALDIIQRHLAQRYAGASLADAKTTSELLRHGALLSEVIARTLGGTWIDVRPSECGYWGMLVPPSTRCWPIGRVYRYVALGPRDRDLVSYYLDLEKRSRQPKA